jgi:transcriptional antiterminator NusG
MAETTTGKKWYVLKAVSGKEAKVKEYLEALMRNNPTLADSVGEILLPTEKYAQLRNGKRVVKEKLFLPGYVLVEAKLDSEITHTLRYIPNVLGFLGGMDKPSPVRQADINRIMGTAEETAMKTEESEIPYMVDEAVKVTDGPFSGFSGVIEEVNTEKHKLKVMVKIFGRKTPLELGFNQVEKE